MEWNKNVLTIEEVYTESKTGSREKNEDAVYYNADFIAVIDGATSKTEADLDGKTGGAAMRAADREHDPESEGRYNRSGSSPADLA